MRSGFPPRKSPRVTRTSNRADQGAKTEMKKFVHLAFGIIPFVFMGLLMAAAVHWAAEKRDKLIEKSKPMALTLIKPGDGHLRRDGWTLVDPQPQLDPKIVSRLRDLRSREVRGDLFALTVELLAKGISLEKALELQVKTHRMVIDSEEMKKLPDFDREMFSEGFAQYEADMRQIIAANKETISL